ncbi:MAG TPA: cytochrome c oxidase subunit II, partial [Gammaproteobacteria bacterium]|nr:cytochrome c oxidase subunit II [Gammaproteobacteria bacterium]
MCFKRIYTLKTLLLILGILLLGTAQAEYGVNFPEPAGKVAHDIYDIHMLTMKIATFLLVIVFSIVFYSVYFHRKSRGYQPDQNFH